MTIKTIFAALALLTAPTWALAEGGCSHMKGQTEASLTCAAGTVYDSAAKACVATTS